MTLRVVFDRWYDAQDLKVWDGSQWKRGCFRMWDGSQWIQIFGQNGQVVAGPGGTFNAQPAVSDGNNSAGSGIKIRFFPNGNIAIIEERGGNVNPGGFGIETILNNSTFTPTVCSPDPPLLSTRVLFVSGDSDMLIQGSYGTWEPLGNQFEWGFFSNIPPFIVQTVNKTVTIDLQLALSDDLSNVLETKRYTFSGSAQWTDNQ